MTHDGSRSDNLGAGIPAKASSCGCDSGCGCSGGSSGMPRREFLRMAGLGMVATSMGRVPLAIMAGPFGATDAPGGHLVPADKRLDPAWVRGLYARGVKEVFSGKALDRIGMPCGGIATGQLYLCGDGSLGCWQIFNDCRSYWVDKTNSTYLHEDIERPVDQGFAVVARTGGNVVRKHLSKEGFADITFKGEYPIGTVAYSEAGCPVRVEMEAFSPYIPLNAKDSALPLTVFNITVENVSSAPVSASVQGWLQNAVSRYFVERSDCRRRTRFAHENGVTMAVHSSEGIPLPERPPEKPKRPVILFEGFEKEGYGTWKAEGEAFGKGPARGTLEGQQPVKGFEGKGLVNSFHGGDDTEGTLTSPVFRINRRYIRFLVGGGSHKGKTCVNLMIGGRCVRTATGVDKEDLAWTSWDVTEFEGKKATIQIVDSAAGGWGHINVDQIEFADEPKSDAPAALEQAPDFGTLALAFLGMPASAKPAVLPDRPEGEFLFEGDTVYDGRTVRRALIEAAEVTLEPGAKGSFAFVLAWHFPNLGPNGHEYAERFADAPAVVRYLAENRERLTARTRQWRDLYYDSSLPYWLLDRLHSTMSYLATGTCQWWRNGRFWAFEGVTCCEGTCTHVWNYAHGHARLFPELGRCVREMQDFGLREEGGGFNRETGLVGFRSNDAYAADGQCGTILKAYREHLMSADDAFLRRNWPRIKKALEFSISHDANADGLIEDLQHNTYDINYFGPNTFVGALYLAALRAGEEMAREVGDDNFARRARVLYESGRELTMARLWNGEYFIQDVDLEKHPEHQYGPGCLSDHLFGQGWAHQVGLGYLYPEENVRTALESVWKYNWAPDITPYNEAFPPFRWFISPGQGGLLTCTWPKSEYLPKGTLYKDEVWTGIEYQVAGHMVWEDMVDEALVLCRAVHDRYHPELKNPYNEVECGDHYARALASWGVYLALAGFEYHGPHGHLGFAPRITPEGFRAVFTTSDAWVIFEQQRQGKVQTETLTVASGTLRLRTLSFAVEPREGEHKRRVDIEAAGRRFKAPAMETGGRIEIFLPDEVVLNEGEMLTARV